MLDANVSAPVLGIPKSHFPRSAVHRYKIGSIGADWIAPCDHLFVGDGVNRVRERLLPLCGQDMLGNVRIEPRNAPKFRLRQRQQLWRQLRRNVFSRFKGVSG